jgi:hypothetical protein
MPITHATEVATPDDGTSEVGSDEWNAPHVGFDSAFSVEFSREGTAAVIAGTSRWYNDTGVTLSFVSVRASVGTAPTGASLKVDVNKDGTTIFTSQNARPEIAVSTFTDESSAPDVGTIFDGSYLTVDIDQVGSTIPGSNVVVQIWMTP